MGLFKDLEQKQAAQPSTGGLFAQKASVTTPTKPNINSMNKSAIGDAKAFVGGIASGIAGPVLTGIDWLGRKAVNAFGGEQAKKNLAGSPSLHSDFGNMFGAEENPGIYKTGQIGGQIAALAAPVGAIGSATKVGAEALGAGKLTAKLAQAGAEGAAFTAGQSLAEGKKQSLADYAINTGINMAFPIGGAVLNKLGDSLPSRIVNSLIKPLAKDFAYGKDPGKSVAKLGIVANNFDDLITGIRNAKQKVGQIIGSVISPLKAPGQIDLVQTLKPIDEAIATASKSPKTNASLIQRLKDVKDDLVGQAATLGGEEVLVTGGDIAAAQELKGTIGDLTKWTGNVTDDQAVNKALRKSYGNLIEQMDSTLQKSLSPEEFAKYKEATEDYGNLISAENAATYRDKILERQDLISFGVKNAGLLTALTTAVATGGAAIPSLLAGLGGVAIEKGASSPAFKTRLASLLSKLGTRELSTFFDKVPTARSLFTEKEIKNLGTKIAETPGKTGGYVNLGGKTIKAIDGPTKKEMENVIDYIRLKKPVNMNMEDTISKLTNKFGINADASSLEIAKTFENLITKTK